MSGETEGLGERHRFTLAEANALLPEVRRLLAQLRRAIAGLDAIRVRITGEDGELQSPEPDTPVAPGHFRTLVSFHHAARRFADLGIQVKDVRQGLIDFPATAKGGREVLLCWQEGEESVAWFHDLESGFAGRKPIEEMEREEPSE